VNILVDTHVLIWWLNDTKRLGRHARATLSDPANTLWMSAVSIWEISIKTGLGLLDFRLTPERGVELLLQQGFRSLPIGFDHALAVRYLPLHHKDPFDRMLVAQAQCERLTLLTADPKIRAYDVPLLDASQ
jgi:PIN domain nuclease of toxin-antitoxin system